MNLDAVKNEANDKQDALNEESFNIDFDSVVTSDDVQEDQFEEMLDKQRSDVLKEFRESKEFSEKKEELSQLSFGEIASLHQDKLENLAQCTDEYKELYLAGRYGSPEDVETAQQQWEEACKECDVSSIVLNEKTKELRESDKEEANNDGKESIKEKMSALGAGIGIVATLMTPVPENSEEMTALYAKFERYEQQAEREKEKYSPSSVAEPFESGGPEPKPEPSSGNEGGINASFSLESGYQLFDQREYSPDVTVSYGSVELGAVDIPEENTLDHKHLDEGFKYFDKIASSEGDFTTLAKREFTRDSVVENKENSIIDNIQKSTTELSQRKIEEVIDSGNLIQEVSVEPGEKFIRIGGETDSGTSPYFTKMEEISDISFFDENGNFHLDTETYRERSGLPETSNTEICRVYEARDSGTVYSSVVAETAEHWGAVKHAGGGTQFLILNRNELLGSEPVQKLQIYAHSKEEFNDLSNKRK